MTEMIKIPLTSLTVKKENFFLLVIIRELIINAPLIIPIIPSSIALTLAFSKKSYNHSYFKFFKYFVLILSIFDFIGVLWFFIELNLFKFFGYRIPFVYFDFNRYFVEFFFFSLFFIFFLFWKILFALKFIKEINLYGFKSGNEKTFKIKIFEEVLDNENFDKKHDEEINNNAKNKIDIDIIEIMVNSF